MNAITLRNISKMYRLYDKPQLKLKEALVRKLFRTQRAYHREFWALRDINLDVPRGSTIGIIGQNGSGKSTLLQIITGILQPTTGTMEINGRISALLELGAGFNPEFTGRENVFMNGSIMGLKKEEIEDRFEDITRFAEIDNFIDQPVKTYSSGMYVRLAFSIAINVDPDILIVDEALSVGDIVFQHRCMRKIKEIQERGVTILFVSHDPIAIKTICNLAMLLDGGKCKEFGAPDQVSNAYLAMCRDRQRKFYDPEKTDSDLIKNDSAAFEEHVIVHGIPDGGERRGSVNKANIIGVRLYDGQGKEIRHLKSGETATIRISAEFLEHVENPIIGMCINNRHGLSIIAANTFLEGLSSPPACQGMVYTVDFSFDVPYLPQDHYSVSIAVANGSQEYHENCDWIDNAIIFILENPNPPVALVKIPFDLKLHKSMYCHSRKGDILQSKSL